MKIDTLAAIDIGSNAIRLLISNVEQYQTDNQFKKLAYLRVPIRLGEDVFSDGCISDLKKQRLLDAMQGFSHIMKAYNVLDYRAYATSAMREAVNGLQIVDEISKASGITIEIISGQQEADTIYHAGGLQSVMNRNSNYLYVDVGGGSTEIVVYSAGQKVEAYSFQLGTVRMLEDAVDKNEMETFKQWLKLMYKTYQPQGIIASGGNINKVHKMLGKKERESVSYIEMKVLYDTLTKMSFEERIHNLKLNPYRADVIVPALHIFLTIAEICKINETIVPKVGVVDGIIHQLYANLHTL